MHTIIGFLVMGCLSTSMLLAQYSPQFEEMLLDGSIDIGYGLAIGDVDGDGKDDIILADKKEFVWYRNGDWRRNLIKANLTERDNVCIAAQDVTGDGKVEIAVGAQWNPGETTDAKASGSVHYLERPEDLSQEWEAVALEHVPTIHRMRWVKTSQDEYKLVVLPLHGIGNSGGNGAGVQVLAYSFVPGKGLARKFEVLDKTMHLTHNFDGIENAFGSQLYIGGKEGIQALSAKGNKWTLNSHLLMKGHGYGEVRIGKGPNSLNFVAGVEPMHGNVLSISWLMYGQPLYQVLATDLNQGHALACADMLGQGIDQVIVGWRNPNDEGKVGLRMYVLEGDGSWTMHLIDDNGMACEDLKVADLNGDGKLDIVACGRATKNLKIYWNRG